MDTSTSLACNFLTVRAGRVVGCCVFEWKRDCWRTDVAHLSNVCHIGYTRLQCVPISEKVEKVHHIGPANLAAHLHPLWDGFRLYLKSGNPHPPLLPAPPSDRSPFVFSFSTTAINKHPVTISNCLSHREGGVGQIVMRDCKWYLSQILSCAWWMLTLCAHLKSHKGEKPKHCILAWLFSSVNAQLHMWDLVTAMKHGKDEDGRPPGYQRESRKWM